MSDQRTDRGERDSGTTRVLHHRPFETDATDESFARFGQWLDAELVRLEKNHVLIGARPTRIMRR